MKSVRYVDLVKGEYYAMYKEMMNKKTVFIFQLMDSKPVVGTFSIIMIKNAWYSGLDRSGKRAVQSRQNYVTNLPSDADCLFELSDAEIQSHIIIPQL